jgi:hypothetical protein
MGTDLHSLGNHNIQFQNRKYSEIAEEIREKLDAIDLHNSPFLRHNLLWEAHVYDRKETKEEIWEKKDWAYDEEFELEHFDENKTIEFYGPLDLEIDFRENYILLRDPSFRYWQWFEPELKQVRDEWRKYIYRILKHFGGDRVVYLADNGHNLENFIFYEGTFEEMEKALKEKFGKPQESFPGVLDNYDNTYFIDYFNDLDFDQNVDFDAILPINTPKLKKPPSDYFNS